MNSTGEIYRDVKSQFPLFVQSKTLPVYTAGEMYNQTWFRLQEERRRTLFCDGTAGWFDSG